MSEPGGPGAPQGTPQGSVRKTVKVLPSVIKRDIQARSRTTPFLIWVSFLLSFSIARIWVIMFRSVGGGKGKEDVAFEIGRNIIIGGYHVHHIAVGVLLLAIAGWAALHWRGRQVARVSAIMYGIGLGFIVDEVGFIIGNIQPYRGDVEVFYIAVFLCALLFSVIYFPSFWRSLRRDLSGIALLIRNLPSLQDTKKVSRKTIDQEIEAVLGPVRPAVAAADPPEPDPGPPAPMAPPVSAASTMLPDPHSPYHAGPPAAATPPPPAAAPKHTAPVVEMKETYREPLDKQALFGRLLGRVVDVMILIVFAGLLLGLAKLILSLTSVFIGLSVAAMMQPILVGTLTLLIGVELFRAMVEYVRSARIMLPFLVDAGILLGLREIADELYRSNPDPILVAVIGGTLVALGGLRVFTVKTMLPPQNMPPGRTAPER